jgi:hypothetical protein
MEHVVNLLLKSLIKEIADFDAYMYYQSSVVLRETLHPMPVAKYSAVYLNFCI